LVEEYGEINFSLYLETKRSYEIQVLSQQVMFLWYRTCKRKKRRRFERILAFGQYVSENSKYASEYPENVSVKELPKFNGW
jgi:hypothetical protein